MGSGDELRNEGGPLAFGSGRLVGGEEKDGGEEGQVGFGSGGVLVLWGGGANNAGSPDICREAGGSEQVV